MESNRDKRIGRKRGSTCASTVVSKFAAFGQFWDPNFESVVIVCFKEGFYDFFYSILPKIFSCFDLQLLSEKVLIIY